MAHKQKIYKNQNYLFSRSIVLFLLLFCLLLNSCSITKEKLGLNYITEEFLDEDRRRPVNGVLPTELWSSIHNLQDEGFIGIENEAHDAINVKKHLMFTFYYCLQFKQESTANNQVDSNAMMTNILGFFREDPGARGLMFTPIEVRRNNQRVGIKFILNNLLTNNDPHRLENLNIIRDKRSPKIYLNDDCFLVQGNPQQLVGSEDLEIVHVDHLLRDNIITIELPSPVHDIKTRLLDKLTSSLGQGVERKPQKHWRTRVRELPE